jgi:hypothetical protein
MSKIKLGGRGMEGEWVQTTYTHVSKHKNDKLKKKRKRKDITCVVWRPSDFGLSLTIHNLAHTHWMMQKQRKLLELAQIQSAIEDHHCHCPNCDTIYRVEKGAGEYDGAHL